MRGERIPARMELIGGGGKKTHRRTYKKLDSWGEKRCSEKMTEV